jgi:thioredoxin-like negative regulator of GroEL
MDEDPAALMRLGDRLLLAGRSEEAMAAYQRVIALKPDAGDAWFNLAYLQRHARQFEAALDSYAGALAAGAAAPEEIRINRAVILSEYLGRGEEAEAELTAALAANPKALLAWLNLGNLYEDWGDVARARWAYEQALGDAPRSGRALARLTAIDIFEGRGADRIGVLGDALARPGLSVEDAAELRFALAAAREAAGDYRGAFAEAQAANRLAAGQQGGAGRYDRAAHEALIDALIALGPPDPLPALAAGAPQPIFICGMFRSGSTLAESLLARHSRVTAGGELDTIPAVVANRLQPYPQALADATAQLLEDIRRDYLDRLRILHPGAGIVTDKRPDNFLHIGLIKCLFPGAKIVHTRREPLDNLLSIFFLYFEDSVSYGASLEDAAHWYRLYRRLMSHWKSLYGADIHDLDYDALVDAPDAVLGDLLAFCGLPAEPLLQTDEPERFAIRTPSAWQVRRPLHRRSSGRWRHYEEQVAHLRALLAD